MHLAGGLMRGLSWNGGDGGLNVRWVVGISACMYTSYFTPVWRFCSGSSCRFVCPVTVYLFRMFCPAAVRGLASLFLFF